MATIPSLLGLQFQHEGRPHGRVLAVRLDGPVDHERVPLVLGGDGQADDALLRPGLHFLRGHGHLELLGPRNLELVPVDLLLGAVQVDSADEGVDEDGLVGRLGGEEGHVDEEAQRGPGDGGQRRGGDGEREAAWKGAVYRGGRDAHPKRRYHTPWRARRPSSWGPCPTRCPEGPQFVPQTGSGLLRSSAGPADVAPRGFWPGTALLNGTPRHDSYQAFLGCHVMGEFSQK